MGYPSPVIDSPSISPLMLISFYAESRRWIEWL